MEPVKKKRSAGAERSIGYATKKTTRNAHGNTSAGTDSVTRRSSMSTLASTTVSDWQDALEAPNTTETEAWITPHPDTLNAFEWALFTQMRLVMNGLDDLKRQLIVLDVPAGTRAGAEQESQVTARTSRNQVRNDSTPIVSRLWEIFLEHQSDAILEIPTVKSAARGSAKITASVDESSETTSASV